LDVQTFLQNFFFNNKQVSSQEDEEEEEESPQKGKAILEGVNEESNEDEDSGMDSRVVDTSRIRRMQE